MVGAGAEIHRKTLGGQKAQTEDALWISLLGAHGTPWKTRRKKCRSQVP